MKTEAILNLYSTVVKVYEDDDNIIAYDINENEVAITDWNAVETKATELQAEEDAKEQAKIDAKESGNQKLLDLGLTQAEATALTGYTPPSED
ncbi:hypothetical protein HTVC024P_gp42 [Pelagibacter phage HTVC024P]|nr:hypothetical protein HTVC024P_gp42 [Pelagibacter phage HTVC024P]